MHRTELAGLIHNGESSGVEFKRDDVTPQRLAKEMAALLNLEAGYVLLGVEKDKSVSGLTREPAKTEEWVMEVARSHLRPPAIPFWATLEWEPGKVVGIASLPADAPDKPYKMKRGSAWVTQIRAGTTSRDASDTVRCARCSTVSGTCRCRTSSRWRLDLGWLWATLRCRRQRTSCRASGPTAWTASRGRFA